MMMGILSTKEPSCIPKVQNFEEFSLKSLFVMELMCEDDVLYALSQYPSDAKVFMLAVVNKFKKKNEKAKPHVLLNEKEEPATLITITLIVIQGVNNWQFGKNWKVRIKTKIQSELTPIIYLPSLTYKDGSDSQQHVTKIEKMLLSLTRLSDPVDNNDKGKVLLRPLPDSFGFTPLVAKINGMDYNTILVQLK